MLRRAHSPDKSKTLSDFTRGKSTHTISLLNHFLLEYKKIGPISIIPAKTMIGIATSRRRICYIMQLGKDFIHIVFMFKEPYPDNLCFLKIAQVPGQQQFNHHLRIFQKEDINKEVKGFMKMAWELGQ